MLKRFYADNYGCLVNFEVRLEPATLFIGQNGSGKSTVLDALTCIRALTCHGEDAAALFFPYTRTKWQQRSVQRFELQVEGPEGSYEYRLEVEYPNERARIHAEEVQYRGGPLYRYRNGSVELFQDDHSAGPSFPYTPQRSFLANLEPPPNMARLAWLRSWLSRILHFKLAPDSIKSSWITKGERGVLSNDGGDFAAYYRQLVQVDPAAVAGLQIRLRQLLPGFNQLRFKPLGDQKALVADFGGEAAGVHELPFFALSDGQAVLIALHALLVDAGRLGGLLCIDEPDNFVTLPEIQPWLVRLRDTLDEGGQALLISHHPAVIDYMAPDCVLRFDRPGAGLTRVRPLVVDRDTGLSPSELVARGWDSDDERP